MLLLTIAILLPNFFQPTDTTDIVFVGDIMQHGFQLKAAHIPGRDTLLPDSYGFGTWFKYVKRTLEEADFAVANMETTIEAPPYSGYPNFSAPISLVEAAKSSGIDLFLCANNHICDKGRRGLHNTIESYRNIGADFTGIYTDEADLCERDPFVTEINGMKVAFVNFTYGTNGIPVPPPFIVGEMDTLKVKASIQRGKAAGAEYIIALPHWGEEYSLIESDTQRKWGSFLLSNGVNAVIGSHPHVIQPIVETKDSLGGIESVIAYSLGNFISNMSKMDTQMGYLFTLRLIRDGKGNVKMAEWGADMVWCPRKNGPEGNYTTVLVEDFIEKDDAFIRKSEHLKMKKTYERLNKIFYNGERK